MSDIRNDRFEKLCEKFGKENVKKKLLEQGVSKTAVNYWMNGDRYPSAEGIILICQAFNVSADWLLGLQEEKVMSKNLKVLHIHKVIGLAEDSIKALNFINEMPKDNASRKKIFAFLDRELTDIWERLNATAKRKEQIFPNKPKTEMINEIHSLFELLEDAISGSQKVGIDKDLEKYKDDLFRRVTLDNISKRLEKISEEVGTVKMTKLKTDAIEWIRKRYIDSKNQGTNFSQTDFENALREFEEDYFDEDTDEGIELGTIKLDYDDVMPDIMKED